MAWNAGPLGDAPNEKVPIPGAWRYCNSPHRPGNASHRVLALLTRRIFVICAWALAGPATGPAVAKSTGSGRPAGRKSATARLGRHTAAIRWVPAVK